MGADLVLDPPCRLCGGAVGVRERDRLRCATCGWAVGDIPDPELPRPRVAVVYYLRFGDRVKIGTTASPRERFAALPRGEVLAFELGGRDVERARHRRFAADRLGTSEWFALSPAILDHLAALDGPAGHVDPWARYARWVAEAFAGD